VFSLHFFASYSFNVIRFWCEFFIKNYRKNDLLTAMGMFYRILVSFAGRSNGVKSEGNVGLFLAYF